MKHLPLIAFLLALLLGSLAYMFWPEPELETSTYTHEFDPAWATYEDSVMSFKYPERLPGRYIRGIDWPPKIEAVAGYECEASATETGRTEEFVAQGRRICATTRTEGVAGSTYTDYRYVIDGERPFAITFSVKRVSCASYDEPEQTACRTEQEYDIDAMVLRLAESVAFR